MPYVNKKHFFATGAIALILALIFLNTLGLLNPIKNFSRRIFLPISKKSRDTWLNLYATYDWLIKKDNYINIQNELTQTKQNLDQLTAQIDLINTENKTLRTMLDFKEDKKNNLFITKIISLESSNAEKTIVIDGGTKNGIKVGQAVIVNNGILIGKIIKVEATVSFVRLLVDNQSKVAVTVLNNSHSIGVAEGGHGISIKINFIPRNENVAVDDMIVTSGLETGLPRGLLIGKVVAIENESYQPFQQAVVLPEADLSKINIVGIVLSDELL